MVAIARRHGAHRSAPAPIPTVPGETILGSLQENARLRPDRPAMRRRRHDGGWEAVTWAEYARAVGEVAAGLADLGVAPGDRVGILSDNRVEWHLADLGAMAAGGITVPLYPTSSASQVAHLLAHADVRVCFVDTHERLGKVLEVGDRLPQLRRVVLFDAPRRSADRLVTGFGELRATGAGAAPPAMTDLSADDPATIVYTSGTTGPPKGAVITHGNIMWTLRNATPPFGIGEGERLLSFLPLSHIAERMMSDFLPVAVGGETWFARSLATVGEDLPSCRPTVFLAVPRVWEKLREAIEDEVRGLPLPLRLVAARYVALGLRRVDAEQGGGDMAAVGRLEWQVLDRLLGASVRRRVGLDRAHVLVTAAAPAHPHLVRWFHAIGLPVLELYGQTEDCGPTTANRPERNRIGTVGPPLPGVSVRIADDGEILVQGGNVCRGYHRDPGGTAALIDADGWMHSGDLGVVDPDGYLRVIGRKKDLLITAAGKNIAPEPIEADLREHPLISQAVVVGEGRRFVAALVTLDPEEASRWALAHHKLVDLESLASDPDMVAAVGAHVEAVNSRRSRAESIRKFRIVAHELTVEDGQLTPTLKVKRPAVHAAFADLIDDLYAEAAPR